MGEERLQHLNGHSELHTKDFFTKARGANKRNYIYDYGEAKTCPHNELTALATGGTWYRCKQCNYALDIVAANMQPLHSLVQGSLLNALHFAKEFGASSLFEVARTPIGQYDGAPHKPVLPEGVSMIEALALLDQVDVTAEDGGKAELKQLLEEVWSDPKQKAKYIETKEDYRKMLEGLYGSDEDTNKLEGDESKALPPVQE